MLYLFLSLVSSILNNKKGVLSSCIDANIPSGRSYNLKNSIVVIENCFFIRSQSVSESGGVILLQQNSNLTCIDCVFSSCAVDNDGGAIYFYGLDCVLNRLCSFKSNSSRNGMFGFINGKGFIDYLSATNSKYEGVGVLALGGVGSVVRQSNFSQNMGKFVSTIDWKILLSMYNTIAHNYGVSGAIFRFGQTSDECTLRNCNLIGNNVSSTNSRLIDCTDGNGTVEHCVFINNYLVLFYTELKHHMVVTNCIISNTTSIAKYNVFLQNNTFALTQTLALVHFETWECKALMPLTPQYTPEITPELSPFQTIKQTVDKTHNPTVSKTIENSISETPKKTPECTLIETLIPTPNDTPLQSLKETMFPSQIETPCSTFQETLSVTHGVTLIDTPEQSLNPTLMETLKETLFPTPHETMVPTFVFTPVLTYMQTLEITLSASLTQTLDMTPESTIVFTPVLTYMQTLDITLGASLIQTLDNTPEFTLVFTPIMTFIQTMDLTQFPTLTQTFFATLESTCQCSMIETPHKTMSETPSTTFSLSQYPTIDYSPQETQVQTNEKTEVLTPIPTNHETEQNTLSITKIETPSITIDNTVQNTLLPTPFLTSTQKSTDSFFSIYEKNKNLIGFSISIAIIIAFALIIYCSFGHEDELYASFIDSVSDQGEKKLNTLSLVI